MVMVVVAVVLLLSAQEFRLLYALLLATWQRRALRTLPTNHHLPEAW